MNTEKKDQKEKEVKVVKKSTYSKKKKTKKNIPMVELLFYQHLITQ